MLFRPDHLQHLVRQGLWSDAVDYFHDFAPAMVLPCSAKLLLKFIRILSRISNNDAYEYDDQKWLYGSPNPGGIKLAKIISSLRSEQARYHPQPSSLSSLHELIMFFFLMSR